MAVVSSPRDELRKSLSIGLGAANSTMLMVGSAGTAGERIFSGIEEGAGMFQNYMTVSRKLSVLRNEHRYDVEKAAIQQQKAEFKAK